MKNLKQIMGVILFVIVLIGCSREKSLTAQEILADKEMRKEIMMEICEDEEMMNHIMNNKHSMQMMSSNRGMMKNMMHNMMSDSTACSEMHEMIMKNGHMSGMMKDSLCTKKMCSNKNHMKKYCVKN